MYAFIRRHAISRIVWIRLSGSQCPSKPTDQDSQFFPLYPNISSTRCLKKSFFAHCQLILILKKFIFQSLWQHRNKSKSNLWSPSNISTSPNLSESETKKNSKLLTPVHTSRTQVIVPHTAGRYQRKKFRKALCPLVERLAGQLMFHGRNTGKKARALTIIRQAFEIVHLLTGENPLAVLVAAVQVGGAREDFTKLGNGGQVKQQAVDVSPLRRINDALHFLAKGVRESVVRKMKTISEALADELIACSKKETQKSYCIKKRDETEKVAKLNR